MLAEDLLRRRYLTKSTQVRSSSKYIQMDKLMYEINIFEHKVAR